MAARLLLSNFHLFIQRSCLPTAALALLATLGVAHADETLPGGGKIEFQRKLINENGKGLQVASTQEAELFYFNRAHCTCSRGATSPSYAERSVALELRMTQGSQTVNRPGQVFIGAQCEDNTQRPLQCTELPDQTIGDIQTLVSTPTNISIPISTLQNPKGDTCDPVAGERKVYVLVDGTGDGTFEYFPSLALKYDAQPPDVPTAIKATGSEGAIALAWTAPSQRLSDIRYYQALCATLDDQPAQVAPAFAARYQTANSLCGLNSEVSLTAVTPETTATGTGPDANTTISLQPSLAALKSAYVCGQAETTATEMRITDLNNGVPYAVALLAIDQSGNAAGVYLTQAITPNPVTDLWEDLHNRGSEVEGGLCLLAQAYGDDTPWTNGLRGFRDHVLARVPFGQPLIRAYYGLSSALAPVVGAHLALKGIVAAAALPVVAMALFVTGLVTGHPLAWIALLTLAVALLQRRRIRYATAMIGFRRWPAWAASTLLLAVTTTAHAQPNLGQPYWNEEQQVLTKRSAWHMGLRLGPYTPAIDSQFTTGSPYNDMFGSKTKWLPMFDLDRVVWDGFGQLTLGGSIGYMSRSANAYKSDGTRSDTDSNAFKLLPLAMQAGYRFTWLHDRLGIPLVPYARGGLAYYAWWIRDPNGDIAQVCQTKNETSCMEYDEALGASLGYVAAVGLAIRAEGIDENAKSAMNEGGIEHAGFYAEFSTSKVDGFGNSQKLAVGDSTFFAGVNWEF